MSDSTQNTSNAVASPGVDQTIKIDRVVEEGELKFVVPDVVPTRAGDWKVKWMPKSRYTKDFSVLGIGRASEDDDLKFGQIRIVNKRLVATFKRKESDLGTYDYILFIKDLNTGELYFPVGEGVAAIGVGAPNPRPKVTIPNPLGPELG